MIENVHTSSANKTSIGVTVGPKPIGPVKLILEVRTISNFSNPNKIKIQKIQSVRLVFQYQFLV